MHLIITGRISVNIFFLANKVSELKKFTTEDEIIKLDIGLTAYQSGQFPNVKNWIEEEW